MSRKYRVPLTTLCPVCSTWYGDRRPGARCGDFSQGQLRACPGYVIEASTFDEVEWRRPAVPTSASKVLAPREIRYDVIDGGLILTVGSDCVDVCDNCPDFHIRVLPNATRENVLKLAAGIAHLAEHCLPEQSAS